jgi:hypothetical protein
VTERQNLVIQQGATFEFKVQVVGGPASLVGATAHMQARELKSSTDTILSLSTDDGLTIDAPARIITISIPAEDTAALDWVYPVPYDLELTAEGKTWRVIEGTMTLSKEVTR